MTTVSNNVETNLEFNAETKKAQQNLDALNKRMVQLRENADKAEEGFRTMSDVSAGAAAAGALLFAPAILSAQKYIDAVGKSEAVSKKYIAAQERANKAQVDFGRKSAQALLPYRELLTDITERLARVDPRIISAGIAIGGGIALVGAAGLIASQIGLFATAVVKLGTYINTLSAVQAAGGLGRVALAGGVGVGALAAGTAAGIGITRAIGRSQGDERLAEYGLDDTLETFKQLLVIGGALFLDALGGAAKTIVLIDATLKAIQIKLGMETDKLTEKFEEAARNLKNAIIELVGESIASKIGLRPDELVQGTLRRGGATTLTPAEQAAADAAQLVADTNQTLQNIDNSILELKQGLLRAAGIGEDSGDSGADTPSFSDESLDLFDQFQQAEKDALEGYQADRKALNKKFADENLKLETDYNRQRQQQLADFNKAQAQAEKDFDRQQKRQASDNARQIANLRKQAADADTEALAEYNDNRVQTLKDFQTEELKRQAAFDQRRKRQAEETNERLLDAAGKLDAQAIFQILRDSTKQARQDQEDFGGETASRQADLKQRLDDDKRVYDQQKQQRQKQLQESISETQRQFAESQRLAKEDFDYRQGLARQQFEESRTREAANFERQQQERRVAHVRELNDLQNAYNQQKKARQAQFIDAYNQLNGFQQYEASARQAHYKRLAADLQTFLNGAASVGAAPKNSGGTKQKPQFAQYATGTDYVPRTGMALLHQGEGVLTAAENRAFAAMGGRSLVNQGMQSVTNNRQRSIQMGDIVLQGSEKSGYSPRDFARLFRQELTTVLEGYTSG